MTELLAPATGLLDAPLAQLDPEVAAVLEPSSRASAAPSR